MKINQQKSNWILDALLFIGLLVAFAMDWTGLPMHQWIGVFGGLLATYHLILHWDWATSVTMRFFGKTSHQARTYYLLDAAIMIGFYLIVITGIVISTWLNLALTNYTAWVDFHITTSILTLILVVLKISLHSRWIVRVARQSIFRPVPQPAPVIRTAPVLKSVPAPVSASGMMTRRDFLKLMGIVGVASLAAVSFTFNNNQEAQAGTAVTDSSVSQSASQAYPSSSTTTTTTASCAVQCNKRCSFPGNCHRYQDTNGNNRCDFGECT
jgi:hypothetical protein